MAEKKTWTETIRTTGKSLVGLVQELVHQGNIRRIVIRNDEGRTLMVMPLNVGVVGAILAPTVIALGVVVALVAECTIVVERQE